MGGENGEGIARVDAGGRARIGTRGGGMGMNAKELSSQASVWIRCGLNALGGPGMKVKAGKWYALCCRGTCADTDHKPSRLKAASNLPLTLHHFPKPQQFLCQPFLSSVSWRKVFMFPRLMPFRVKCPPNTTKMGIRGKWIKQTPRNIN